MKKIIFNAPLNHKAYSYEPMQIEVEKVITLYGKRFEQMRDHPLEDAPEIIDNKDLMYMESNTAHCILFLDANGSDGILVEAEGSDYARKSQFISNARAIVDQNELTPAEQQLHQEMKRMADKIAGLAHRGEHHIYFGNLHESEIIKSLIVKSVAEMLSQRSDIADVKNHYPTIIQGLIDAMPEIIIALVEAITTSAPLLLQGFKDIWDSIIFAVTDVIDILVNLIKNLWNWCVEFVGPVLENYKAIISNAWNAIKNGISNIINGIKTTISNVWENIKTATSNAFEAVRSTASSVWNGIKTAITTPITTARDFVKSAIDKMKSFFNFSWELPKIKLPHFSMTGKFSLDPPSIPSFGVEWYAKAMDKPLLMNSPTIFGYNPISNSLMGGGEAGSEVVSGTNTLMGMISNAVSQQTGGLSYYLKQLVAILTDYFPQLLEAIPTELVADDGTVLAHYVPLFDDALGKKKEQTKRGR